jgi:hypothetical protein
MKIPKTLKIFALQLINTRPIIFNKPKMDNRCIYKLVWKERDNFPPF